MIVTTVTRIIKKVLGDFALYNKDGNQINPATEEGQTAIGTAIGNIPSTDVSLISTKAKQDTQITLETQLETLVETLQELVQRLAPLASAMTMIGGQSLRVTPLASVSTAVTGPITSANSIAEKAVGGISYAKEIAVINQTATLANINNAVAN